MVHCVTSRSRRRHIDTMRAATLVSISTSWMLASIPSPGRRKRHLPQLLALATSTALLVTPKLDWQVQTDPPCRQSHALFGIHVHARIVALKQ